jgi:aminoglycoside phosphotransferase (APT) family kinase protein
VHAIPIAPQRDMDGWMAGWLNVSVPWWISDGAPPAMGDRWWAWFHRLQPLLSERDRCLTLFDGRPEHFIVNGSSMAGLIDLHDAQPGDPAMDLALLDLHEPATTTQVVAGYDLTQDERAIFAELVPFYRFLRGVAAVDWLTRIGHDLPAKAMRARVAELPFLA